MITTREMFLIQMSKIFPTMNLDRRVIKDYACRKMFITFGCSHYSRPSWVQIEFEGSPPRFPIYASLNSSSLIVVNNHPLKALNIKRRQHVLGIIKTFCLSRGIDADRLAENVCFTFEDEQTVIDAVSFNQFTLAGLEASRERGEIDLRARSHLKFDTSSPTYIKFPENRFPRLEKYCRKISAL